MKINVRNKERKSRSDALSLRDFLLQIRHCYIFNYNININFYIKQ
jgi:hypothetical protein